MRLLTRLRHRPGEKIAACLTILLSLAFLRCAALAQEQTARPQNASEQKKGPTLLQALVAEALERSPLLAAARSHWQAQTLAPIQAATIPDPQVQFQQLSVGGPAPMEGYETSDFFYTGFGVAQDIPGPGKLKLARSIAEKEADYARHRYEAARREVTEKVRESYFELFFLTKTLDLLDRYHEELERIEQIAEARYRVGEGLQQDVVKAQLQVTEILKERELERELLGERQAELKAQVGREPDSRDIEVAEVEPSPLKLESSRLSQLARAGSPEVRMERAMEERSQQALKLARKGYIPDFSISYMFQRTGPGMRDYYMLTVGAKIPLYFWRRQTPAIEQSTLESAAANASTRARELDVTAAAQSRLVALETAERVLKLYREGLIPQARNSLDAAMAAYRVGKVDFQTLLSAFIDLLNLDREYYRELADHEIAVARIEQIVGDLQ